MSREYWKPCSRALAGTVVLREYENVAAGSYASRSSVRRVSSVVKKLNKKCQNYFERTAETTDRKRKLLTIEPSTPVTNEAPISDGNLVAVGRLIEAEDVVDDCGTSKEIWAIGSWSRTCNDENRCAMILNSSVIGALNNVNYDNLFRTVGNGHHDRSDTLIPVQGFPEAPARVGSTSSASVARCNQAPSPSVCCYSATRG